jgi:hypothetical protein
MENEYDSADYYAVGERETTTVLDRELWHRLVSEGFERGSHSDSDGHCVMEAVAVATGHEKSDYPPCVGRVQARLLQTVNDSGFCTTGQLADLAERVVGTGHTDQVALANALADYVVREFALGSGIDSWAQDWLAGRDRSQGSAQAAARAAADAAARAAAWAAADTAARAAVAEAAAEAAKAGRAAADAAAAERRPSKYTAYIEAMIQIVERKGAS